MRPIPPASLTRKLTPSDQQSVTHWWQGLEPPARRRLRVLFAEPMRTVPRGRAGRLVDPREHRQPGDTFPEVDLYEYIVGHELVFASPPVFHIFTAHEAARTAVRSRTIPSGFTCPFARQQCAMRAIVDHAGGRDVRLVPFRASRATIARNTRDGGAT